MILTHVLFSSFTTITIIGTTLIIACLFILNSSVSGSDTLFHRNLWKNVLKNASLDHL